MAVKKGTKRASKKGSKRASKKGSKRASKKGSKRASKNGSKRASKTNYKPYCMVCKGKVNAIDLKLGKTKNGRKMIYGKCAKCGTKVHRFVKNTDTKESLGL